MNSCIDYKIIIGDHITGIAISIKCKKRKT